MGLNFRKSISLGKCLRLNIGKSSSSISFGGRGAHYSVSTTGKRRATVGLPGTGLSYTKTFGTKGEAKAKENKKKLEANSAEVQAYEDQLAEATGIHKGGLETIDWKVESSVPRELRNYANAVCAGEIDSYYEVIEKAEPFEDLLEYGSEYEIGTDAPDYMAVEFNVKEEEVIPTTQVTLTSTGKVSEKEMGKSAYYALVQDYVCSVMIRLGHDIFALLPVDRVIVHAVDEVLNTATGHKEEATLVSVIFDRETFYKLNLDAIDPSDALENFRCNMKFTKTQGFKPVTKLEI